MGMDTGGTKGVKADINITPLVDVVLVLLIIFMVMTPLAQRGYDLEIPKENAGPQPPPDPNAEKNVMLALEERDCAIAQPLGAAGLPPNCSVRINDESVPVTGLQKRLDEIFKGRKKADKILFLAIQEKLNYEGVVQILDTAKVAVGPDLKLAIVTKEELALRKAL